jgi:predicted amidohydrolase YtcJ
MRALGAVVLTACVLVGCGGPSADLVLRSGKVVTLDEAMPEAEAVAVVGDRIAAVGSDAEIERWIGASTEVIDLEGRLAIPGFIEAHGHLMKIGRAAVNLPLAEAKSWDEIVGMVRRAADAAEPGRWIFGRGWHQDKWSSTPTPNVRGFPVHDELSRAAPDNPVHLRHASGHASVDNARAMERVGITAATPDPSGGEILRRPDGTLAGVFLENAEDPFLGAYEADQETEAEVRRLYELGAKECLSKGVTSFHDAGVSFTDLDVLKRMADDGNLGIRVYAMVDADDPEFAAKLAEYRIVGQGDGRLTIRAVKAYIDGALGSRGAWLLEPYADLPDSAGETVHTPEEIAEVARLSADNGFQLCVHAIGDRGNREVLDVYERILRERGDTAAPRWRVEHAQHLHPDDIPRFGELGVIAAMQPVHCTSDGPWVPDRIGAGRAEEGAYVWRDLLDSGAVIAIGTDAPVENVDPIRNLHAAVTRRFANGTEFHPEQRMSREEALRAYTVDAAYAAFEEEIKGTLAPGRLADMVVLSQDILTVPDHEILDTEVLYTILSGKVVHPPPTP